MEIASIFHSNLKHFSYPICEGENPYFSSLFPFLGYASLSIFIVITIVTICDDTITYLLSFSLEYTIMGFEKFNL